jgi:hypothetical protein
VRRYASGAHRAVRTGLARSRDLGARNTHGVPSWQGHQVRSDLMRSLSASVVVVWCDDGTNHGETLSRRAERGPEILRRLECCVLLSRYRGADRHAVGHERVHGAGPMGGEACGDCAHDPRAVGRRKRTNQENKHRFGSGAREFSRLSGSESEVCQVGLVPLAPLRGTFPEDAERDAQLRPEALCIGLSAVAPLQPLVRTQLRYPARTLALRARNATTSWHGAASQV